jgi:hypothetical protein
MAVADKTPTLATAWARLIVAQNSNQVITRFCGKGPAAETTNNFDQLHSAPKCAMVRFAHASKRRPRCLGIRPKMVRTVARATKNFNVRFSFSCRHFKFVPLYGGNLNE